MYVQCILLEASGIAKEISIDSDLLYHEDNEIVLPYFNNLIPKKLSYKLGDYLGLSDMVQWSKVEENLYLMFPCVSKWSIEAHINFTSGKKINKAGTFLCKKHTVHGNAILFNSKGNLTLDVLPDLLKKPLTFTVNNKHIAYDLTNSMIRSIGTYANRYDAIYTFFDELLSYGVLSLEDVYIYLGPMAIEAYIDKDRGFYNAFMDYNISYKGISVMLLLDTGAKNKSDSESENYLYIKPKTIYRLNKDTIGLMNKEKVKKGWKKIN